MAAVIVMHGRGIYILTGVKFLKNKNIWYCNALQNFKAVFFYFLVVLLINCAFVNEMEYFRASHKCVPRSLGCVKKTRPTGWHRRCSFGIRNARNMKFVSSRTLNWYIIQSVSHGFGSIFRFFFLTSFHRLVFPFSFSFHWIHAAAFLKSRHHFNIFYGLLNN